MARFTPLAAALAIALGACSSGDAPVIPSGAGYKVGKPYVVKGVRYTPRVDPDYDETGLASWYGPGFQGKPTANGEIYDMNALTAAHKTLPLPSRVRVENLENGRSIVLKVNDRGPFVHGRIIDVSKRAARELGFLRAGVARVRVTVLDSPAFRGLRSAQRASAGSGARDGLLYVQAGSFVDPGNAWRLHARLSRIRPFEVARLRTPNGTMHRVRAGPLRSDAQARALIGDLRAAGYPGATMVRDRSTDSPR